MTTKQFEIFEGTDDSIVGYLLDSQSQPIVLDGTYKMEFAACPEDSSSVAIYKSSVTTPQIIFDDSLAPNAYRITFTPSDTIRRSGRHVFTLNVTRNGAIFHVEQGALIIHGVSQL